MPSGRGQGPERARKKAKKGSVVISRHAVSSERFSDAFGTHGFGEEGATSSTGLRPRRQLPRKDEEQIKQRAAQAGSIGFGPQGFKTARLGVVDGNQGFQGDTDRLFASYGLDGPNCFTASRGDVLDSLG